MSIGSSFNAAFKNSTAIQGVVRFLVTISVSGHGIDLARLDRITKPSQKILVSENREHYRNITLNNSDTVVYGIYPWHSDGANILFCDGHVKWLKSKTRPAIYYGTDGPYTVTIEQRNEWWNP